MTESVSFNLNETDGSLTRAKEANPNLIEIDEPAATLCAFEDGDFVHKVILYRDVDGWQGTCYAIRDPDGIRLCRGWKHHDGPCAHLWAVRSHIAHKRLCDAELRHDLNIECAVADGNGHGGRRR